MRCTRSAKQMLAEAPASKSAKRARLETAAVIDVEDLGRFADEDIAQLQQSLLTWYDQHHRTLPWRRNPFSKLPVAESAEERGAPLDMPQQQFMYWVWVCEVMSQQTQVSRAAEYFKRWMLRWPTLQDFAGADIEEVNEMWAGLGYYRRARYLLDGAKYVMSDLGGTFPVTSAELQKIPGVGAYTGAAIASIAAGERVAVVDANVMRILARLRCLDWDLKNTKRYSALAGALMHQTRPGDFNQALMELGARICTPTRAPACDVCPIQQHCQAFQRQKGSGSTCHVTDFPVKAAKARRREEYAAVSVVELQKDDIDEKYYLLVQRPKTGLLAGLWEFPLHAVDRESDEEGTRAIMDRYLRESLRLPLCTEALKTADRHVLGSLVHVFSHIHLTLRVEILRVKGPSNFETAHITSDGPPKKWISEQHINSKGLSSSVKKVWSLVRASSVKGSRKH